MRKGRKKKQYTAPENVYDLDDDHMFKTMDGRPVKYAGLLSTTTVYLGSKKKHGIVGVDKDDDNMSAMSRYSKLSNN